MSATFRRYAPPSPAQTAPPAPAQQNLKRRRSSKAFQAHKPRDTSIVDQPQISAAQDTCFDSPNNVISCWPESSSVVAQHEWASFVWNSRLPQWAQTEKVNIFLFQADSGLQVVNFTDVENPLFTSGLIHVQVDDRWWGTRGNQWNGQNISFPFYFEITRNDHPLDNSAIPQATFTAVQTTFADSIVASMSSSSALAAASSRSVASSLSADATRTTGLSATLTPSPGSGSGSAGASPTGGAAAPGVQGANGGGSFPKWAIAVIVVLGFLALVASGILAFYIMRRLRQRREGMLSHRNSMGSSTPMMANADRGGGPQSPVVGSSLLAGSAAGAAAGYGAGAYGPARPSSPGDVHDGASMMSRASDAGPFSGADAAIMANAFRQALRKPDFADRPVEEGESPDDQPHAGSAGPGHSHLINQELAEEGRDIRSVSSSRGVKVETLSDDEDGATVQDH
ncbi:uncharacterized protein TRAVEDRAFT_64545 [Trametes versicolor FP-101664 SS1]|uniref:uncharacterized protein n=1 Tax=Trametes versicolor (strain FP-101664) TaxID=717944 RepID=UPI0004622831|nr:uncharacterized protein TRAVEDRAFT_64545 [Trametes versicolor FP-101664 SS1]EIW59569.1 hypothetical protein TRAVEDRAFT_64545 [Trametes versicolor FP-101664 SS1]